jgi:hypothetical protein
METLFGSSLPSVVCRRIPILFVLFVCGGVLHILCCRFVLFFFVCDLCCQFFLDCPFLNAPSVFSNVYKGVRVKFVWLRISIMFPSETCLHMNCCVSKLAIIISTRLVGLIQTGHLYTLSSHRMQLILTMIKTNNG